MLSRWNRLAAWLVGALAVATLGFSIALRPGATEAATPSWADPAALDSLSRYLAPVSGAAATPSVLESEYGPRRDPFTSAGSATPVVAAPPTVTEHYQVSAILIAGGRRLAVVNDRLVGPGDPLPGGGRVAAVADDHVVVVDGAGARRLLRVEAGGSP